MATAYWDEKERCWFVPVASELMDQGFKSIEPVRLELKDGQLIITELES